MSDKVIDARAIFARRIEQAAQVVSRRKIVQRARARAFPKQGTSEGEASPGHIDRPQ